MSLTMLRERQRFFLWMVAILVIPSFIILYGADSSATRHNASTVCIIDGKPVSEDDYISYLRRMDLLTPNPVPNYPVFAKSEGEQRLLQVAGAQHIARVASEQGLQAFQEEVDTFIRKHPSFQTDGVFDAKKLNETLKDYNVSLVAFRNTIAEQMLISKFERIMDFSSIASNQEAYRMWAMENTFVQYGKVEVPTADFKDAARAAIGDLDAAVDAYVQKHPKDPLLKGETQWKLEGIGLAYDDAKYLPTITEEEYQAYMDANAAAYKGKSLEDVKAEIRSFILRDRREKSARYVMDSTVGSILIKLAEKEVVTADDVLQSKYLENQKVASGETTGWVTAKQIKDSKTNLIGGEPLPETPTAGAKEALKKYSLPEYLNYIDGLTGDERKNVIADLKRNFSKKDDKGGFAGYFYNQRCAFRVRIVDVKPGEPRNPKEDAALHESLVTRIVEEKAQKLAAEAIDKMRTTLIKKDATEMATVPLVPQECKFVQQPSELENAIAGMPTEAFKTADGYQFFVLQSRMVPTFEQFSALDSEEQNSYVQRAQQNNNRMQTYGQLRQYRQFREDAGPLLTAFLRAAQLQKSFYIPTTQN